MRYVRTRDFAVCTLYILFSTVKKLEDFFQNFVVFSEYLNFNSWKKQDRSYILVFIVHQLFSPFLAMGLKFMYILYISAILWIYTMGIFRIVK